MKTILSAFAIAGLSLAPIACNESPKGGSVTSNRESTSSKETFTIKAPSGHTTIKQGEKKSIDLTVDRSSNFKQAVKLEATAPSGIKVDPSSASVAAADSGKVSMTVEVEKDAPVGDSTIKITGTPTTGTPTSVDVTIKVEK